MVAMVPQDIFVGIVAVATGLFVLVSALVQSRWIGEFWLTRHVEQAANQSVSRMVLVTLGAICTLLGTLLLLGFFASGTSQLQTDPSSTSSAGPSVR